MRGSDMKRPKAVILAVLIISSAVTSSCAWLPAPEAEIEYATTSCRAEVPVQAEAPAPTQPEIPEQTESPIQTEAPAPETADPEPPPVVDDEVLVSISEYIPSIYIELKYAASDNFTGEVIYDFTEPLLKYGTVKKLAAVQESLLQQGYSLLIWDAYRPQEAQFKLWEICPDANYVANPYIGGSSHSQGNTLDLTLVLSDGTEIEMPTGFDDFSALADRDYSDVSETARENATLLENAMQSAGFTPYYNEWWHYTDK